MNMIFLAQYRAPVPHIPSLTEKQLSLASMEAITEGLAMTDPNYLPVPATNGATEIIFMVVY